jgi:5-methylcytosine-specific restriction endonuclease McrA
MRIELWLLLIAAIWIANIYTEGKYVNTLWKYKKYYHIGGVVIGTMFVYYLIRKNPMSTSSILSATNEYIRHLPLDKNSASLISPILDFTKRQNLYRGGAVAASRFPVVHFPPPAQQQPQYVQVNQSIDGGGVRNSKILSSGRNSNKRSVSETKKKFVASRQNWRCGKCDKQLSAWFEVDHKIRLEYGGDNHIDNLVALCRECHGEKTAMENL